MQKKSLFRPKGSSTFPLRFLDSIISNIFTFSCASLSVRRPSRKTTVVLFPLGNSTKRFHLKDPTKNSIKTVHISSLLNTDLGDLNDSSLI